MFPKKNEYSKENIAATFLYAKDKGHSKFAKCSASRLGEVTFSNNFITYTFVSMKHLYCKTTCLLRAHLHAT